ncbi:MAG: hypothetical protein GY906_00860 [bacterium]|nr:hypothetical protein [bacterium]
MNINRILATTLVVAALTLGCRGHITFLSEGYTTREGNWVALFGNSSNALVDTSSGATIYLDSVGRMHFSEDGTTAVWEHPMDGSARSLGPHHYGNFFGYAIRIQLMYADLTLDRPIPRKLPIQLETLPTAIAVSQHGTRIAVAEDDRLAIFDAGSGDVVATFSWESGEVLWITSLRFVSPTLVSASLKNTAESPVNPRARIVEFDIAEKTQTTTGTLESYRSWVSRRLSPSGNRLLLQSTENLRYGCRGATPVRTALHDAKTGMLIALLDESDPCGFPTADFLANDTIIMGWSQGGETYLHTFSQSGEEISSLHVDKGCRIDIAGEPTPGTIAVTVWTDHGTCQSPVDSPVDHLWKQERHTYLIRMDSAHRETLDPLLPWAIFWKTARTVDAGQLESKLFVGETEGWRGILKGKFKGEVVLKVLNPDTGELSKVY